jgi:hypothetical protein
MVQCNYLVEEVFSPEVLLEHGIYSKGEQTHKSQPFTAFCVNTQLLCVISERYYQMKYNLRYLLIVIFVFLTICFVVTLGPETSTPNGDKIFFTIAFLLIYGGIFLISLLAGNKERRKGIPIKQNIVFLNSFLIITILFYLFVLYFLKYRFIMFPKDGIYGETQIITDDKGFNIGRDIAFIHSCSSKQIEMNIKGRINIVVESINLSEKTSLTDTIYKTEILYLLNDEEKELKYFLVEFDKNCNTTSLNYDGTLDRKKDLIERAKEDNEEIRKIKNKYILK